MGTALYRQLDGDPTTTSGSFVDIEELNFTLPAGTSDSNAALVTLNVHQPYADGGTSNGISYQIDVNGSSKAVGTWTNQNSQDGRSPFTMVTMIPLNGGSQFVQAQWLAVRGGTAHLGGSANLSAVLVQI
jgi:hypothetical protein